MDIEKVKAEMANKQLTLPADKSATAYVLLALFLGGFGIHNLWAGNSERGKLELIIGLVGALCCCFVPTLVVQVMAWLDIAHVIDSARKGA